MRSFAEKWPFRRKLNVLVGVPLVVILLLLAYVITGLTGQARDAATGARLVRDSRQIAELIDRVETEHQQAVLLSVRYESATSGRRPSLAAYAKARAAVDAQVGQVRAAFGDRLPPAEAQVLKEISGLSSLRSTIEQSYLPADNIDPAYTAIVDELIDGLGLDQRSTLASTVTGSLLDSLLRAEAAHSSLETSVFSAQTGDTNALIEFVGAVGYAEQYAYQASRFGRFASDDQRSRLAGIEQNPSWNAIALQYAGLQIDPSALAKPPTEVQAAFDSALQEYPTYQKQAQTRLRITGALIDQVADRADRASDAAWWRAAGLLAGALLGFVLWLGFSVAIRRSVVRPVQALTDAATQVAEVAGDELARVADDDAVDAGPLRLREVPVPVRDELGDLAEAFNRVQNTAAALLERQVLSRRNVAEMFGNVGRRVSNLTARQLALIDALERGETDPALLDRLYRIDHLAVRLQRNADSLMLLAGIREAGLDASPTALTNVVRAALGQIEGYQRVSLIAETSVTVAPDIIADLTLMLAELLENAVAFSPVRSPVEVSVRNGVDGALIEISDHGLGMSAERLAEENARLIRRERLDLAPTKVLGLFVVGSLARRWGIRVTLSRTPGGGVTSRVTIPAALMLLMSPFAAPEGQDARGTGAETGGRGGYGREAKIPLPEPRTELPPVAEPLPEPRTALPPAEAPPRYAPEPYQRPEQPFPEQPRPAAAPYGYRPDPVPEPYRRPPEPYYRPEPDRRESLRQEPPPLPRRESPRGGGEPAGPRHAAPVPPPAERRPDVSPLPRRVPQAQTPGGTTPRPSAAREPEPVTHETAPAAAGGSRGEDTAARPLRRRVRGATLGSTLSYAQRHAARAPRPPVDAEEVRSELDEFEAAVERAQRDSAPGASGRTTNGAGPLEGAEQ
ncbi:ATP-binding protein [Actinacidiphila sp. ITFR-21]|uniref:ATP-binding protein n=1 Tax=Actinacidiphila sp. ITFR-21 TaxID=3075199 RepID=UPI00288C2B4D|nr:ATP-binding protein [Streptomyces sp. ITFR-21]WNI18940.1 HAMP domain-containing protein [Streptomyces sp. ITFR-21]